MSLFHSIPLEELRSTPTFAPFSPYMSFTQYEPYTTIEDNRIGYSSIRPTPPLMRKVYNKDNGFGKFLKSKMVLVVALDMNWSHPIPSHPIPLIYNFE